ncbi:potassium transporter TrkG [Niallia endozanthoxylica]|uniref:potassium transporter TrkG n=1 Tax=Niallia endozanthoxylica TaxID=2036016 RepID=UPI001CC66821|nr:potassium transporter TrkG [Niallia endozanthoxylica]
MNLNSHSKKKIRITSVQMLVMFYFAAVILSTILLLLPITLKDGAELTLLDALFISASAVSVTGLSTVSLTEILSVPGTFIFAFILQFGGIGVMTLGTFIWLLLGKKIGLMERKLIMTDQNQYNLSGLVILMRQILLIMIVIEVIGTLILGFYFLKYFPTWEEAFLQGFFASISATTNAGFDITGESLIPFANDYFIQTINILLMIFGSIGFPVLIEIKDYFIEKRKKSFRFSLFTKLTTFTFEALIIVGAFCIYIFEFNFIFLHNLNIEHVFGIIETKGVRKWKVRINYVLIPLNRFGSKKAIGCIPIFKPCAKIVNICSTRPTFIYGKCIQL